MYMEARARKDRAEADRLFLDALVPDRAEYFKMVELEEEARAFSVWLCGTALGRDHACRWIGLPEIESCAGGTFESRIEDDGTRRGFKALAANPELWLGGRKIRMRVPADSAVRRSIRCVQYAALPRQTRGKDERIGDPKSAKHASEAETREPDGAPIPPGTDFAVLAGAGVDREAAKVLGSRYRIEWADG